MLVPKLLRIDEATIQEIEELSRKLSEKEHTSFSALVRTLIRKGLDDMEKTETSFIKKIKDTTGNLTSEKEKVLEKIKKEIEESANLGYNTKQYTAWTFKMSIISALNIEIENISKYFDILQYVVHSLFTEGFEVQARFDTNGGFWIDISW